MNRQLKRAQAKQERVARAPTPRRQAPAQRPTRTSTRQFVREVVSELKKVAWPTASEVSSSTVIVLVTVIVLTALIAGLDFVIGKLVLAVFG